MIVKKIPRLANDGAGARARHVQKLIDYMRLTEKENLYAEALLGYLQNEGISVAGVERLYHLGARNFLSETIEGQRVEMMASASRALRSPNPLDHWLISWKETERPSPGQIDEAAAIFLAHLGLGRHQAIYAAHADTHNIHLHVAVNRYDPFRNRMHKVNKGFNREAAHQAIALIADKQGWAPEDNARFRVANGKLVMRPDAAAAKAEGRKSLAATASSFESRTGVKSAQRIAIEEAAPIMRKARTWAEAHYGLAKIGVEYLPTGSGAVLEICGEHVKASAAHRTCSHQKMTARLGDFKARTCGFAIVKRQTEAMPAAIMVTAFHKAQTAARTTKTAKEQAVREKRDKEVAAHDTTMRLDLRSLGRLKDGGGSPERSMLTSLIREKADRAKGAIKEAAKAELAEIRRRYQQQTDYEAWLRSLEEQYLADRWRRRNGLAGWVAGIAGDQPVEPTQVLLSGYEVRQIEGGRLWSRKGGPTAFIEWPDKVEVAQQTDKDVILAAFQLAQAKYGTVTLLGPHDFQTRAAQVITAAGHADKIKNPEWHIPRQTPVEHHKQERPSRNTFCEPQISSAGPQQGLSRGRQNCPWTSSLHTPIGRSRRKNRRYWNEVLVHFFSRSKVTSTIMSSCPSTILRRPTSFKMVRVSSP